MLRDPDPIRAADAAATIRAQWDAAAGGWNAHAGAVRTWLQPATQALLRMARLHPGAQVLDVAAGAGDQTLDIAREVGPAGRVLATDLSPMILAHARENAARAGLDNVHTRVADGQDLGVEPESFDAAVCRLGLMFFPDPLQGLREMQRALRPGSFASTLVFAGPDRNPCVAGLMAVALKHAGLPRPDPDLPGGLFSLGRPGRIDALFRAAGFVDVATTRLELPYRLPSAAHYLAFIRDAAGPIRQIMGRLDPAAAAAAWSEMAEYLAAFDTDAGWAGPHELLLTAGRR